jgi:ATP/maltotriose-dependent transcriptional regulator MalT/DNA-binding SARP family transcriptional activator
VGRTTPVTLDGEIRRPRLNARLDEATAVGRLTLVIAGAGYGKSSLLRSWAATAPGVAWHTIGPDDVRPSTLVRNLVDALRLPVPDLSADIMLAASRLSGYDTAESGDPAATAAALAEALDGALRRRTVLVLDDLDEVMGSAESTALVDALIRHAPEFLHVVVAGREQPPFRTARLVAHSEASEIDATELAFTAAETAELAERLLGGDAGDAATAVHRITGGWPVAVHLALEALAAAVPAERGPMLVELREPRGLLLRYMADEVIGRESAAVVDFLERIQVLDGVEPAIAAAVGVSEPERMLRRLVSRGVYLEPQPGRPGRTRLRQLFRSYFAHHRRLPDEQWQEILTRAGHWHEEAGEYAVALCYATRRGAGDTCARLLREHGALLIADGEARAVRDAAEHVPAAAITPDLDVLVGDAELMLGEWDAAAVRYRRAAGPGRYPAAVAWRLGLLHYLRGELTDALEAFDRGDPADPDLTARALLLGWSASASWIRGDVAASRTLAGRAFEAARASADHRALACVHTVLAMLAAVDGDRAANDAHYLKALDHATAVHDVLQLVRIHANRSSQRLEEGDAGGALVEAELAVRLADLGGLTTFRALALSNRGEALLALGRLDEARAELEAAAQLFDRIGSSMAAYPSAALGDVHLLRGDRLTARAAYQRAVTLAETVGDVQGMVSGLVGLARLAIRDDPDAAQPLIDRALSAGASLARTTALVTAARAQLAAGAVDEAVALADQAAEEAAFQRDRAGAAEAIEVRALATRNAAAARAAVRRWRELDHPVGTVRAMLVLARLEESPDRALSLAEDVAEVAQAFGARDLAVAGQELIATLKQQAEPGEVVLTCLGGFTVSVGGAVVAASSWQSRKARDLLKVLVCRQGRPIHREQLMELLWPDEDPSRTGNRLSVALSTVRAVLDPQREKPPDHYVRADGDAITLTGVDVDVERLLEHAAAGLRKVRQGALVEARAHLEAAELTYRGDLLEADPYADWAVDLREKARLAYLDVVRALAGLATADGDHDAQARYLLRILEHDPYDEAAHLDLVRLLALQGRHGEARRRYRLYARSMGEIGVEAASYPVTAPRQVARSTG